MRLATLGALTLTSFQLSTAGLIINSAAVNPSLFRVTQYASPGAAYSMQRFADGSLAVLSGNSILRFVDADHDGIADGPGTVIYQAPGAFLTGFVQLGDHYAVGDLNSGAITLLHAGATPADMLTAAGAINLGYPSGWFHPTAGLATRPTPGSAGSYDLVFNVGAQFNNVPSSNPVTVSGLINGLADGDALYLVTINLTGAAPTASNLRQLATGIRNVAGMQFAADGTFYFADNAIDGPGSDGDEPPQADELNAIGGSDFDSQVLNFGYPTCYTAYRTGAQVGSGCVDPIVTFQPLNSGAPNESQSEGPGEIAFSPSGFPAGFDHGVFIGFAGKSAIGPNNEENAVGYYDFVTGTYVHFIENRLPGVGRPIGLLASGNSLFISDLATGVIYQISPADIAVPEPSSLALLGSALAAGAATAVSRRGSRR